MTEAELAPADDPTRISIAEVFEAAAASKAPVSVRQRTLRDVQTTIAKHGELFSAAGPGA